MEVLYVDDIYLQYNLDVAATKCLLLLYYIVTFIVRDHDLRGKRVVCKLSCMS